MGNLEKKSITQVKKLIREKGTVKVYAVGNKVSKEHFFKGWNLAVECVFVTEEELIKTRNQMMAYLPPELGNNISWYCV